MPLFSDKRKSHNQRLTKQDERDIRHALLDKIPAHESYSKKDMHTYLLVLTNFINKKIPGQKTTPGLKKNGVFDVQRFKKDLNEFELATILQNPGILSTLSSYPESDMELRLMRGDFKKGNALKIQQKNTSQNPPKEKHDGEAYTIHDWNNILKQSFQHSPKKLKTKHVRY
jgi:hypothetical protein